MAEIKVGGFVETIHNINGILIGIRDSTKFGKWALIVTADNRVFQCPIEDLRVTYSGKVYKANKNGEWILTSYPVDTKLELEKLKKKILSEMEEF